MSSIWIVMPILAILMFLIGTELKQASFKDIVKNPTPIIIGLIGQLVFLPIIAISIGLFMNLSPIYFAGLMLIALSPGGSSSNAFTLLAKGNIELSVLLTLFSSIITIFTLPIAMKWVTHYLLNNTSAAIELVGEKIILQNILLTIIPILLGIIFKRKYPNIMQNLSKLLHRIVLPFLLILVFIFILQHIQEIYDNFIELGTAVASLIIVAILCSSMMSRICKQSISNRRTIVVEVGMQNAAQAIAIATSPFVFNNEQMALPAIIYTLFMNIILLLYVLAVTNNSITHKTQ